MSGFKMSGYKTSLKHQVYKTSGLQNVRFTKSQVFKTSGCKLSGFKTSTLVNITKCPLSKKYIDLPGPVAAMFAGSSGH